MQFIQNAYEHCQFYSQSLHLFGRWYTGQIYGLLCVANARQTSIMSSKLLLKLQAFQFIEMGLLLQFRQWITENYFNNEQYLILSKVLVVLMVLK